MGVSWGKWKSSARWETKTPLRPVLEVESGERADTGKGDVCLAGFTGGTDVDEGGVERETLRFVNG